MAAMIEITKKSFDTELSLLCRACKPAKNKPTTAIIIFVFTAGKNLNSNGKKKKLNAMPIKTIPIYLILPKKFVYIADVPYFCILKQQIIILLGTKVQQLS